MTHELERLSHADTKGNLGLKFLEVPPKWFVAAEVTESREAQWFLVAEMPEPCTPSPSVRHDIFAGSGGTSTRSDDFCSPHRVGDMEDRMLRGHHCPISLRPNMSVHTSGGRKVMQLANTSIDP